MVQENRQVLDRAVVLRAWFPVLLSAIFLWAFAEKLGPVDLSNIGQDLVAFSARQWTIAILCAILSFGAVARYDPLVASQLGISIAPRRAISGGRQATALSQFLGFGIITGTVLRWWVYSRGANPLEPNGRSITMWQAFQLCSGVAVTFFIGWGIVSATLYGLLGFPGLPANSLTIPLAAALIGAILYALIRVTPREKRPSAAFISRATALAFFDTLFAALILYTFLPDGYTPFLVLYLIFLASFAIGMVSGLPGGVGPFEYCMVMMLPGSDLTVILPALFAYRLVYFAGPAALAIAKMIQQAIVQTPENARVHKNNPMPNAVMFGAPPETDLLTQGTLTCVTNIAQNAAALAMITKRSLVVLGNPFGNAMQRHDFLAGLATSASQSMRGLCFYRCSAATAKAVTKLGFITLKFSSEARLSPENFNLNTPARASLRRKLRKAQKAGVTIRKGGTCLSELAAIDRAWCRNHDGARGFSTGRFCPELVQRQRLYVAQMDGKALAYVTFSTNRHEWLLDLIRHGDACPDGTVYALIAQAMEDARAAKIDAVSLGNVPCAPDLGNIGVSGACRHAVFTRSATLKGLYQFKKAFDPSWVDSYIATSSWHHIPTLMLDIARAIHRPEPLPGRARNS